MPIRVRILIEVNEFLKIIAKESFGHHWLIGYGDVRTELTYLASLNGTKVVSIPMLDY